MGNVEPTVRPEFLGTPFLDEESQVTVQWDDIWAMLSPVTSYGKRWKLNVKPFLPGEEAEWGRVIDQLRFDAKQWTVEILTDLRAALRDMPDLSDVLKVLETPGVVLSAKQLLALKQFVRRGIDLISETRFASIHWTHLKGWQTVLEPFVEQDSMSFSIQHIANDEYRETTKRHGEATQALYASTKRRDAEWFERTGHRPTRDGQLVLPLPECKALASELKDERSITWLRDTPFESVFALHTTPEMEQAQATLDSTKLDLDRLEEILFQSLTDALRVHLQMWRKLVWDVTELDVRMAKVALLHQWQGAVPQLTGVIQIEQAFHPLVAERLKKHDRLFVPLDLDVDFGANVLCGSNMGGKTVAMSLMFLCQCLAQYAMPVPAKAFSTQLFRIVRFCGAADGDVRSGLSAFGREVVRLSQVWRDFCATTPALVCLDEPGKSTNPVEGESIAVAVVRQAIGWKDANNVLFVATHFPAAMRVAGASTYRVMGLRASSLEAGTGAPMKAPMKVVVEEPIEVQPASESHNPSDRIAYLEEQMDYRIERITRADDVHEALHIAAWLGMPQALLEESQNFLQRRTEDDIKTVLGPSSNRSWSQSRQSDC